jgi:hypothetical protein
VKTPTFTEARLGSAQTGFLCHSHADAELAKGITKILNENGWSIYVDWEDTAMPDKPTRETANRIQKKIVELTWFLFLATQNSMTSRWCPWEIGYADGKKQLNRIIIIPTMDNSGAFHGNEYLQLYRSLDEVKAGGVAVWDAGASTGGVFVRNL